MAGVAALVITPWTVRNWLVHGRPMFIKSSFGYAFWQGNNPISWGTDKIPKPSAEPMRLENDGTLADMNRALWEARHETLYIDDVLLKPDGYRIWIQSKSHGNPRMFEKSQDVMVDMNPVQGYNH